MKQYFIMIKEKKGLTRVKKLDFKKRVAVLCPPRDKGCVWSVPFEQIVYIMERKEVVKIRKL